MKKDLLGTVLRIEKTSIHDGHGLRTVVFLKGCPLTCVWCSTPESQNSGQERGYNHDTCQRCGKCISACRQSAIHQKSDGQIIRDKHLCIHCFECVQQCPQNALVEYGRTRSVAQIVEQICRDEVFFFHSGGGVTISGGECLLQADFTGEILKECRFRGIHTAIESSLAVPWQDVEKVLPYVNDLYADMKHGLDEEHLRYTGIEGTRIRNNLKRADLFDPTPRIHLRIPLIPHINDSNESLMELCSVIQELHNVVDIEILPYHRLGVGTYALLERQYQLGHLRSPGRDYIAERVRFVRSLSGSIPVKSGSGYY